MKTPCKLKADDIKFERGKEFEFVIILVLVITQEANILSRLLHPNIVEFFGFSNHGIKCILIERCHRMF